MAEHVIIQLVAEATPAVPALRLMAALAAVQMAADSMAAGASTVPQVERALARVGGTIRAVAVAPASHLALVDSLAPGTQKVVGICREVSEEVRPVARRPRPTAASVEVVEHLLQRAVIPVHGTG